MEELRVYLSILSEQRIRLLAVNQNRRHVETCTLVQSFLHQHYPILSSLKKPCYRADDQTAK